MKQISARAFREVFRTLDEPVTVSTRGEGGYVKIIGTWTPDAVEYPKIEPGISSTIRFTPAPKPKRTK